MSAKGKRAEAEGVVERVGKADPEGNEAAAEQAKQQKTAPQVWQIKATGALIH